MIFLYISLYIGIALAIMVLLIKFSSQLFNAIDCDDCDPLSEEDIPSIIVMGIVWPIVAVSFVVVILYYLLKRVLIKVMKY